MDAHVRAETPDGWDRAVADAEAAIRFAAQPLVDALRDIARHTKSAQCCLEVERLANVALAAWDVGPAEHPDELLEREQREGRL